MSNCVPESELKITAARASGPGGQNVNKVNSKAVLHWNVGESAAFTDEQKELIRTAMAGNLNGEDELVLTEKQSRSWHNNKAEVIRRLDKRIAKALTPKKKRKETSVPRGEKKKRLEEKKRRGELKRTRKNPTGEDY